MSDLSCDKGPPEDLTRLATLFLDRIPSAERIALISTLANYYFAEGRQEDCTSALKTAISLSRSTQDPVLKRAGFLASASACLKCGWGDMAIQVCDWVNAMLPEGGDHGGLHEDAAVAILYNRLGQHSKSRRVAEEMRRRGAELSGFLRSLAFQHLFRVYVSMNSLSLAGALLDSELRHSARDTALMWSAIDLTAHARAQSEELIRAGWIKDHGSTVPQLNGILMLWYACLNMPEESLGIWRMIASEVLASPVTQEKLQAACDAYYTFHLLNMDQNAHSLLQFVETCQRQLASECLDTASRRSLARVLTVSDQASKVEALVEGLEDPSVLCVLGAVISEMVKARKVSNALSIARRSPSHLTMSLLNVLLSELLRVRVELSTEDLNELASTILPFPLA